MSANMSSFEGGAKMVWDMRSMQESLPLSERVIQAQNTSVRFYRFAEIQIGDIYQETRKLSVLARGISLKLLQRGHDTNPVLRPMLYGMLGGLGGLLVGSLLVKEPLKKGKENGKIKEENNKGKK